MLHGGFNLLLTTGVKDFYAWIQDSHDTVRKVLEQHAAGVWKEFVAGASRFPGVRIKTLEGRRKKEMTRRSRKNAEIDSIHRELVIKSRIGLEEGKFPYSSPCDLVNSILFPVSCIMILMVWFLTPAFLLLLETSKFDVSIISWQWCPQHMAVLKIWVLDFLDGSKGVKYS